MTPRSIRRAIERKTKKAALKAEKHAIPQAAEPNESPARRPYCAVTTESLCWNHESLDNSPDEPKLFTRAPLSAAQVAANRANAQLSTGPTTPEGKAAASLNAVKTALTAAPSCSPPTMPPPTNITSTPTLKTSIPSVHASAI